MRLDRDDAVVARPENLRKLILDPALSLARERARLAVTTYENGSHGTESDCGTFPYAVQLSLPKFGLDTRASLNTSLAAMGMRDAFDPGAADFSGMTAEDRLFISFVIHQANIDVDEKGTEAAAATAVMMTAAAAPAEPVQLTIDRPFIYALRDLDTGAILFLGRVAAPKVRK